MSSQILSKTECSLNLAGVYRRDVGAGLARVWESVFDWGHLPALHADDLHAVTLLETTSSEADFASTGTAWMTDDPVPMRPTRRPLRSVPSLGQL